MAYTHQWPKCINVSGRGYIGILQLYNFYIFRINKLQYLLIVMVHGTYIMVYNTLLSIYLQLLASSELLNSDNWLVSILW